MDMLFDEESLSSVANDVLRLMDAHWSETEAPLYGENPGLRLDAYRHLECLDLLHLVTARDDSGRLCGYAAFVLSPNPQLGGQILATLAGVFLEPEARGSGLRLLRTAEEGLRRRGAVGVCYHSPVSRPCDALYRRLGARQTETVYYKELRAWQ